MTKFQNRLSADAHRTRYPTSEAGEGLGQLCGLSHPLLPAGQAWVGQDLRRAKHPSMKTKAIMISISGIPQASHSQCLVSNLPQMYLIFISSHMKSTHLLELSRPQIDNSKFCSLLFFSPCQVLCKILGFMQGWKNCLYQQQRMVLSALLGRHREGLHWGAGGHGCCLHGNPVCSHLQG